MKSFTPAPRIVLNLPEVVALVQHRSLSYKIHGERLEVHLQSAITPKVLMTALIDLLATGTAIPDPPEAREFLSRRRGPDK